MAWSGDGAEPEPERSGEVRYQSPVCGVWPPNSTTAPPAKTALISAHSAANGLANFGATANCRYSWARYATHPIAQQPPCRAG